MIANECPSAEQLGGFIDGTLSPDALVVMERHLADCDECCAIVAAVPDRRHDDPTMTPDDGFAEVYADETRLGRYVLIERVGSGGMGVVWSAYDPELDRRVALKMLRGDGRTAPLVREARAMARVTHPNVVAVHDVLEADARVFMVMELATGRTASAWLRERPRSWREIIALFVAAGRGLAAAHEQGVVHRDFKPDNVLVDADERGLHRVRVGDFGLASTERTPEPTARTDIDPTDTLTARTAGFAGTPAYMAPEQYANEPADARTDQFAFCVSLWEALFGVRPFAGKAVTELAAAVVGGTITAPTQRRGVPARVEQVLRRGLAKARGDRYREMSLLLADLERATRRRRVIEWVALATVPALVLVLALPSRQDEPCSAAPAWLTDAWDAERSAALLQAAAARSEAALDLAQRLDAALANRTAELSRSFDASCRAAFVEHSIPASEHDTRLACLRQASASVEAIAAFVRDADEPGLARALAAGLGAPPLCDESVELSERAALLAAQVRRATTFRELGDHERASESLVEPLAAAGEPGLAGIAAEALYQHTLIEQRRRGAGAEGMERVLELAVAAGSDVLVFDALNQLTFQAGVKQSDGAAADAYARLALAFAGASQRGDEGRGAVMVTLAQGRERRGEITSAREALEQAHAYFVASGTEDSPRRLPMLLLRGMLDEHVGDLAAAAERYEHARTVVEDAYGPSHPDVAVTLEYLAIVRRKQGQLDPAYAAASRSLRIRHDVLGAAHHETVMSNVGLAEILVELRRWAEAEAAATEALAGIRAAGGQPRLEGLVLAHLAAATSGRGDHEAAAKLAREAVALVERGVGAEHVDVAVPLLRAAEIELARGASEEAVALLERALALVLRGNDHLVRARIELALARALLASGGDERRARELAASARKDADAAGQFGSSDELVAAANAIAE